MNPFQAALIWFGGIAVFALMFEAADAVGGFLGWVVFGFTTIVLLYVTGVIGNKVEKISDTTFVLACTFSIVCCISY